MDNEIRFVHREETFTDLAVRELADTRSACICRLQFGRCHAKECASCSVHEQYQNCYNNMSDYDRQRLAKYVSEQYLQDSIYPAKWMSYKRLKIHTLKWALIIIFCFVLLFLPAVLMNAEAPMNAYGVDDILEDNIVNTLMYSQENIYDLNGDEEINCIDYTIMFKMSWDKRYPGKEHRCIIIRNKSDNMNHLFIGIYDDYSNLVFVEPWAHTPWKYLMEDNWSPSKYNPKYNIYGETSKWLGKVK